MGKIETNDSDYQLFLEEVTNQFEANEEGDITAASPHGLWKKYRKKKPGRSAKYTRGNKITFGKKKIYDMVEFARKSGRIEVIKGGGYGKRTFLIPMTPEMNSDITSVKLAVYEIQKDEQKLPVESPFTKDDFFTFVTLENNLMKLPMQVFQEVKNLTRIKRNRLFNDLCYYSKQHISKLEDIKNSQKELNSKFDLIYGDIKELNGLNSKYFLNKKPPSSDDKTAIRIRYLHNNLRDRLN